MKIKTVFAVLLIASLLGMAVCDLYSRDYKTAALGLLFGVCNVLIFLVK